jgi:fibronectin type 3 domain-containing protein
MKAIFPTFTLLMLSSILTACGGGGDEGPGQTNPPPGGGTTGSISLRWDTPSTKVDGNPLSLSEIDGYKIYVTTNSTVYPSQPVANITDSTSINYTVNNLPAGTYYIYVTTYDMNGDESPFSDPVSTTI